MFIDNAAALALFHPEKMGKTDLVRGEHLFAGLNCFEPGQSHAPHSHPGQDKLYVVLEGSGVVQIGAETRTLSPGGAAFAPDGVEHAIHNPGPARLVVMAILGPPPSRK